jgi:ribosome-binding factor A
MPDKNRSRRIGELIQRELATLLAREVKDPRLALVSITAVDVTRDLGLARVFYTVIDKVVNNDENNKPDQQLNQDLKERVQQGLIKASGFLRYELGQRIQLRIVPKLDFRYDESVIHGAQLTRLIDDVIESDKQRHNKSEE